MRPWLLAIAIVVGCGSDGGGGGDDTQPPPGNDAAGTPDSPAGTPDGTTPSCAGGCPTGYSCASANEIPVCRNDATGIPLFSHIFVVWMENTSHDTLMSSDNTPYLHGLFSTTAYSTNYHGVTHPSLPNYLAQTSGSDLGVACDCEPGGSSCTALTCNVLVGVFVTCGCGQTGIRHLGNQLDEAGLSWRNYAEDLGSPCNMTTAGDYATKHVPFLYYDDISGNPAVCEEKVADYSAFDGDLAAARTMMFVSPNLVHDMHSPTPAGAQNLANGDAWLSTEIPKILGNAAFQDRGLLVIVWDEDDHSGIPNPDDPIPFLLLSPLAKQGGFSSSGRIDHYSLLATWEDGLGLERLGSAATASPLSDFFPAQ